MKNTELFTLRTFDEDMTGTLSMTALMHYLQEAATLHLRKTDQDYKMLYQKGKAYVISRMNISVYTAMVSGDDITVETWVHDCKGVSFNRHFRVLCRGRVAAEAVSVWAFVSTGPERRIFRVTDPDANYTVHMADDAVELDPPAKLKMPENMNLIGEKTVLYSDCDINGHLNNARYPDMLLSFVKEGQTAPGRRIENVKLNFLKEAALGEELKIYHAEYDGVHYFRTVRSDGNTNLEAELIFE